MSLKDYSTSVFTAYIKVVNKSVSQLDNMPGMLP